MCLQHPTKMVESLFAFHRWENAEWLNALLRPDKARVGGGRIFQLPVADVVQPACLSFLLVAWCPNTVHWSNSGARETCTL